MLLHISSKSDYDDFLHDEKNGLSFSDRKRLIQNQRFRSALWRFCHLDPSLISDVFLSLYSQVGGRPAFNPAILLRSYLLMQRLGFSSVDNWIAEARSDACIQYIIGSWYISAVATHYDFINRIMQVDQHLDELYPSGKNSTETKKLLHKLKLKKNEKWENYDEGATRDLKDRYWDDASCDLNRSAFVVEQIFHRLVVIPSSDIGLIDSNNLVLSGDGSALHIHSSPFGHKVKDADTNDLAHRYTAPDADIGWDSDLGIAYFGYTLYNISHHNALLGIDLPVFLTLRTASQHDALITISATAQFLDINQELHPKFMCFDSASDSYDIYEYLRHKNITPVIDWNKRKNGSKNPYAEFEHLNEKGIPECQNGTTMVRDAAPGTEPVSSRYIF